MFVAMWAGPFLSIVMLAPIVWRPIADRGVAGLSATGTIVVALTVQMWLAYGILIGDPRQIVVNIAVWSVRAGIMLAAVWAARRAGVRLLAAGSVAAGVAVAMLGPTVAGVAATSLSSVNRLPQVAHTVRHGRGAGLSVAGFALNVGADIAWATYGLATDDWIIVTSSVIAAALDLSIVVAATRPDHALVEALRRVLAPAAPADLPAYTVVAGE